MSTAEQTSPAITLDNRGLEPPQPMMRVLEALGTLPDGGTLVAINDREPMFLYPQLAARGYRHETSAHPDGGYRIVMWREEQGQAPATTVPPSAMLDDARPAVVLDVRADLRGGNEPIKRIMATVRGLPAGQDLVLVAPFEPIPLYAVLERQGFAHATQQVGPEEWQIRFSRAQADTGAAERSA